MFENSQTANQQSTGDRADRENPAFLDGLDSTTEIQQSGIEISYIASNKPYEAMCKAIRSSAWWLVAWTVFSVFQPNLPWAAVLLTIAIMSFYFRDAAAMFLVYSGVLFWASATNLISGEPAWISAAVIQVVFGNLALREYWIYRTAEAGYASEALSQDPSMLPSTNRESHMAWLALILGGIGLVGLCSIIPAGLILYYRPGGSVEQVVTNLLDTLWELSILGIPVGVAALSISRRAWVAAVAGIAMGSVMLVVTIIGLLMAG